MATHDGHCLNYEGQDPADYSEYDSCYRHIEASALNVKNTAHWLRAGADYIVELHQRLGIRSTSFADSMRVEADIIDPPT